MKSIAPGNLLDGKYEIVGLLGAGGMGEVYKARHIHLNTFRCIKIMKPNLLADESYRQRFLREARLATQIHHPNIAVVHDFELLDEGASYMVTEFIDGTTVRQWSADNGRFPLPLAAEIAVQVLAGLDAIHRRGLLHRDISADNIMIAFDADDCLQAKIIDLGVAKDVTAPADTTQAGMLIGNPKYMSPEQLGEMEEGEQLDARADLYCLGVVLYEMLTGVPPFVARTPNGYIVKKLTEAAPSFRKVQPDLSWPDGLEAVVLRALEKDRRKRYSDARAFSRALEPFLSRASGTFTRTEVERLHTRVDRTVATAMPTEVIEAAARPITAELAFQKAWEDGSTMAWRRFLDAHAQSAEGERAQALLQEAADFERAIAEGTDTALRDFLKRWPDGRHLLDAQIRLVEVRRRMEEEAFFAAVEARTAAAWHDFLAHFPSGRRAERAESHCQEAVAFEAASDEGEPALERFIVANPEGLFVNEAKRILKRLVEEREAAERRAADAAAAEREPKDFDAAWEEGTSAGWDHYLAQHSESPHAAEARRCRQEAVEFEAALATNKATLWRAFLKAWPEGRHRLDAELRLRAVQ